MSVNVRLPASIADHRQLKILLFGNIYLRAIGVLQFFGQNALDPRQGRDAQLLMHVWIG
jgi:hypothetical protein